MNLFELVGLGDVTGLDLLFASAALVGGLLFIAWFFLLMIGGLAGGLLDGVGVDVDMGADLSFKAFTFQGIVAFVLMFGLVGLALSRSDQHQMVALLAGTAAGAVAGRYIGKKVAQKTGANVDKYKKVGTGLGAVAGYWASGRNKT